MVTNKVKVLLADDDKDDCFFFKEALDELDIETSLTIVNDGVELMKYLEGNRHAFPDLIYLDLNMPLKNGYECLEEIKSNSKFRHLPVIIYSTCYDKNIANRLYEEGALYYIRKPAEYSNLKTVIHQSIMLAQHKNNRPSKEEFVINYETILK